MPEVEATASGPGTSAADSFCATLLEHLALSNLNVAVYWRSWSSLSPGPAKERLRNLLPLPKLLAWPSRVATGTLRLDTCLNTANLCIAALNSLEQGLKPFAVPETLTARPTLAQSSAQLHVANRVVRFLTRLNAEMGDKLPWRGSFSDDEAAGVNNCQDIRADAVDLPVAAATCEPLAVIAPGLASQIADSSSIFPKDHVHCSDSFAEVSQGKRLQYALLTVRELQCGKLRLRQNARAVANVFAAAKPHGRQRKIWDGSQISSMATSPPKPRRLANPSCFLELEVRATETLLFSKRDASTFFDVLKVPAGLQQWFAQPALTVNELMAAGMSFDQIEALCDDAETLCGATSLYPTHVVWPMGFSWSSAIAQDTTVATCLQAGIDESSILCPDHDPPADQDELVLVATDDTVLFHRDRHKGESTLRNLDAAFVANGIPRNRRKDVSLAGSITALGCDLSNNPPIAEPAAARFCKAVCKTLDVLHAEVATPRGLHGLLGVWEWFALLQRGFYSIYSEVYKFVQRTPEWRRTKVPEAVLNELLTTLLLSPLLAVGLDRLPLDTLVATDACPDFGFGVCTSHCAPQDASKVCRMAERRGDFVRLTTLPGDPVELSRSGKPRRLKLTQRNFPTVVSKRAKWRAHAGVLEVHGYLLGLKWAARSPKRHHRKVAFLVDAKAVVGAAAKGRSSAHAFLKVLRSAAAYALSADILPRIIYIPSESNPADGPSRGKRKRRDVE